MRKHSVPLAQVLIKFLQYYYWHLNEPSSFLQYIGWIKTFCKVSPEQEQQNKNKNNKNNNFKLLDRDARGKNAFFSTTGQQDITVQYRQSSKCCLTSQRYKTTQHIYFKFGSFPTGVTICAIFCSFIAY